MKKQMNLAWLVLALTATSAAAQTNTFPASGNVGIGTTSPQFSLDITGGDLRVQPSTWVPGSVSRLLFGDTINGIAASYNKGLLFDVYKTGGNGALGTNSVDALVVQSPGNVGIGTTNPWFPLEIDSATSANSSMGIASTGSEASIDYSAGGGAFWHVGALSSGNFMLWNSYIGTYAMTLAQNGQVGIGTTSPGAALEVNGSVKLTSGSNGSITFQDGTTQTTAFIPANCGADFAESVGVTGEKSKYEPGDLLVIDPNAPGKFLKSNEAYSTLVAGIYSTKPGFVGRLHPASDKASADEIPMAMVGRVPAKVSAENGPIKVGDLLVASSTPGYAMKGTDRSRMLGAVIGKALGSRDSGTGTIMVLVTLQ
ncbi:MAG: hypothetical protein WCF30_10285 [Terracidiphilus sp.]